VLLNSIKPLKNHLQAIKKAKFLLDNKLDRFFEEMYGRIKELQNVILIERPTRKGAKIF